MDKQSGLAPTPKRLRAVLVVGTTLSASAMAAALSQVPMAGLAAWAVPVLAAWAVWMSVASSCAQWEAELGPRPTDPDPVPGRPALLDPPELQRPAFVPPTPRLPARPAAYLPGQWDRCNICHRPLTDPLSRWRGIGPDCFRRHRVHWPQGPANPAVQEWERTVARIHEEFVPVIADAKRIHEQVLEDLRAVHREQLRAWDARKDERERLQVKYDSALTAWDKECRRRIARRDAWTSDPRHSLIARLKRLRVGLVAGAVLLSFIGLGITLK